MKFTIEISNDELLEEVRCLLVRRAVESVEQRLFGCNSSYRNRIYIDEIKRGVRQLLRENIDDITEKAVTAATKTIENRGIKELLAQTLSEGTKA